MHVLGLILTAIVTAIVWYSRLKVAKRMVDDTADAVARAKSAYEKNKRRKDELVSPVRTIDDPVLGATVLLYSLLEIGGPVSRSQEDRMAQKLGEVTGVDKPDTYVAYAKWACDQVPEHSTVIRLLIPLWKAHLEPDEIIQLYDMAVGLCKDCSTMNLEQKMALSRLRKGLGIEISTEA